MHVEVIRPTFCDDPALDRALERIAYNAINDILLSLDHVDKGYQRLHRMYGAIHGIMSMDRQDPPMDLYDTAADFATKIALSVQIGEMHIRRYHAQELCVHVLLQATASPEQTWEDAYNILATWKRYVRAVVVEKQKERDEARG